MAENNKNFNELSDEDLDKVAGGVAGNIPQNGITFEKYDVLEANRLLFTTG